MKSLDKEIERRCKRERKARYKYFKKLFKARDAASKHVKPIVKVSTLKKFLKDPPRSSYAEEISGAKMIALEIVKRKGDLLPIRPPKPPLTKRSGPKTIQLERPY